MLRLCLIPLVLACTGCVTTIQPPAAVHHPTRVWVIDYGLHSSLLLPAAEANPAGGESPVTHTEYAFGDWDWYAQAKTGPLHAVRSLLLSDRSTLARVEHRWSPDVGRHTMAVMLEAEHVQPLTVEASRVEAVRRQLESQVEHNRVDGIIRGQTRFVPVPERYWLGHTCNAWTADRLRDLGCRVRGPTLRSEFRVRDF